MTSLETVPAVSAIEPRCADPWWIRLGRWLAESRSHRVVCIVIGIWLLNAFDLALTILAHEQGLLHEQNPVARQMLQGGVASIALFKVGLVLVGSYPLLRFRTARITELGALAVFLAYATLAVHWSTVYELYALTVSDGLTVAEIDALGGLRAN